MGQYFPNAHPSIDFLVKSTAHYLLEHNGVDRAPVPVREILSAPPPSLAHDISLSETLLFGDARWIRLLSGQGVIFVNREAALPEPERRYAMAAAAFYGVCASRAGKQAGFPASASIRKYCSRFARELLMPPHLLPSEWRSMSAAALATVLGAPARVVALRQHELQSSSH
ncbi:MAG: hypothetical protein ACE5FI_16165 [Anaerolineales bacterium]